MSSDESSLIVEGFQENCVVIAIASKISYRIEFILVTNYLWLDRFHGKRYIYSCFFWGDVLRGG